MKYKKRQAGRDERREEFDSLSLNQRSGRRRPGSMNKGGPRGKKR